jgi:hypothetical protein
MGARRNPARYRGIADESAPTKSSYGVRNRVRAGRIRSCRT